MAGHDPLLETSQSIIAAEAGNPARAELMSAALGEVASHTFRLDMARDEELTAERVEQGMRSHEIAKADIEQRYGEVNGNLLRSVGGSIERALRAALPEGQSPKPGLYANRMPFANPEQWLAYRAHTSFIEVPKSKPAERLPLLILGERHSPSTPRAYSYLGLLSQSGSNGRRRAVGSKFAIVEFGTAEQLAQPDPIPTQETVAKVYDPRTKQLHFSRTWADNPEHPCTPATYLRTRATISDQEMYDFSVTHHITVVMGYLGGQKSYNNLFNNWELRREIGY